MSCSYIFKELTPSSYDHLIMLSAADFRDILAVIIERLNLRDAPPATLERCFTAR